MESPTFDENVFLRQKNHYKKVKPEIKDYKEKLEVFPEFRELEATISQLKQVYDENTGKLEKTEQTPTLNQTQIYYLRHQLVQLYQQQYDWLNTYFPTLQAKKNRAEFHESFSSKQVNFPVLPRGLKNSINDFGFENPYYDRDRKPEAIPNEEEIINGTKPYFDFRNLDHLYYLIQFYEELKDSVKNYPDSLINNLLFTLDFYIEKANLSPQQKLIVEGKKQRLQIKEIRERLNKELGIDHKDNYISTIWNKSLELIRDAVELNYDEFLSKDYEKAWKKCSRCGRVLLRDSRNFVRKTKALDGLTGRCKCCDKEIRQGNK